MEKELYGAEYLDEKQEKELTDQQDFKGLGVKEESVYDIITERILSLVGKEKLFWRKSWNVGKVSFAATNFSTKTIYEGINYFMLNLLARLMFKKTHPYWLSVKQAKKLGGAIKKSAVGFPVMYYNFSVRHRKTKKGIPFSKYEQLTEKQKAQHEVFPFVKYYTVFNGDDIKGIDFKLKKPKPLNKEQRIESCEKVIKHLPFKVPVKHGGDRAYYTVIEDFIRMPRQKYFHSEQEYYATLFHEEVHATGHKKRLDRNLEDRSEKAYAFEELIAELGASYLCGETGILYFTLNNSAAYIQGWNSKLVKIMEEDSKFIVKAASQATKAADYMLGKIALKHAKKHHQLSGKDESPAVHFIEEYKKLNGKLVTENEVLSFLQSLNAAIKEKQIRKSDPNAETIVHIQKQLLLLYKRMDRMAVVKIANVNRYGIVKEEEKENYSTEALLKRYADLFEHYTYKKARQLFQDINDAIDSGLLKHSDENYKLLKQGAKNLFDSFSDGKKINISKEDLSKLRGLGFLPFLAQYAAGKAMDKVVDKIKEKKSEVLNGIDGFPEEFVRADQREAVKAPDTFRLSGEMGKFLQDIQPYKYSIVITGDPHAGKTEFATQLINAFASAGKTVGLFSIEQGGLESKDTRAAIDRNISPENQKLVHVTGEAKDGIKTLKKFADKFDVIVVDSWQKLGIPSTMFDTLRHEYPNKIWVIIFQQNGEGGTRGGVTTDYDTPCAIKVHKVDTTFVNNFAEIKKNRGNSLNVRYQVAAKKTVPATEEVLA